MKTNSFWFPLLAVLLSFLAAERAGAATATDPRLTSWFTEFSGAYARVYTNAAAQATGVPATTWSNGSQVQSLPAYSGVQAVYSSSNWVYLRTTGLGSHVMGPWSAGFPNLPINIKTLYSIPRIPTVPATKTLTSLGAIGFFVDGVSMFDSRDGFVWNGSTETGSGTGYWNRDAYVNESATFDPAYAHQPQSGAYHYHANPIALRYLLGDHVGFNPATQTYYELTNPVTKHSPLLGWVRDGFPIYGPYGYSAATNPSSGIRRMLSGYALRNGQNGTQNLTTTGRTNLPAWAVRLYGVTANQTAPNVSASYPLGRYMEDNDYLGDLGKVQGTDFDLDEYNGRYCVTPEYPNGTYAYFVSINVSGVPVFPYNIGRAFYGNPTGNTVTSITEAVVTNYVGGPSAPLVAAKPSVANNTVTLVWSSVEGGTYRVDSSTDLVNWKTNLPSVAGQGTTTATNLSAVAPAGYFRVVQTSLASYDPVTGSSSTGSGGGNGILSVSPKSANRGSSFTLTINLDPNANPAPPPANAPIMSVTVGALTGTSSVHVSQTQVTSSISVPSDASTGAQTVTVIFPGPPNNPTATVTYTLSDALTIN